MGAGVAGLSALGNLKSSFCNLKGLAKSMGAIVRAFDARTAVKDQVESLGGEFLMVNYQEEGEGGGKSCLNSNAHSLGGYAKEMSEGYKKAQKEMIQQQAREVVFILNIK